MQYFDALWRLSLERMTSKMGSELRATVFDVGNDFSTNQIMCYRLRLGRTSDTVFRREIDSLRQWGYGTCYGGIVSPLRRSVAIFDKGRSCTVNLLYIIVRKLYSARLINLSFKWKCFSSRSNIINI